MDSKKYKSAKLNDKGGKILQGKTNRWYIEFSAFDPKKGKLIRKRLYQINNIYSREERYQFAAKSIAKIDALLKEGYYFKNEKIRYLFETLDEVLEVKKQTLRTRTFHSYSSTVSLFKEVINDQILTEVKVLLILKFRDFLTKNRKNVSVNSYMGHLKTLFSEMVKRGYIEENPVLKIGSLKEEISFQNQAFPKNLKEKVIEKAKKDPELWLAIRLLYYCFIRPNEIRQLKICHFDMINQQILIPSAISKNGKTEFVTIPNGFLEELKSEISGYPNAFLFSKDGGATAFSMNVLANRHRKILEELNLYGEYTLYSWKHTGVVDAYKNGVDIKSIQLQCRHHNLSMTDIYLKSLGLYLNKAILQNMPVLDNKKAYSE